MRGYFALTLVCTASACQTYDFEPVEPAAISQLTERGVVIARDAPAEIVLVVDRSGSMRDPADASVAGCTRDGALCGAASWACDPAVCPTRWSELRAALAAALPGLTSRARVGALLYPRPGASTCEPPALDAAGGFLPPPQADDVATLSAAADRILAAVDAAPPSGGTPTSLAVELLSSWFAANPTQRSRFAAVLTDGLPNCNPHNAADADVPGTGCECTVSQCASSGTSVNPYHRTGCLDDVATATAIARLAQASVPTLVVGFGADLTSSRARDVLNALADAGQRPRTCGADSECGAGDVCESTGLCGRRFYPAANAAELADSIGRVCPECRPCTFTLNEAPADPAWMSVLVDGQRVPPGADTWRYEAGPPRVTFEGALCERLMQTTPDTAAQVEVRIAAPL